MTTGGGFDYGENTVAAKVVVDVEGTAAIKEIAQETERFQTQLEAAARASGDFVKYLQQLPEIAKQAALAQKSLREQLEKTLDVQNRLAGGAGGLGRWDVQHGYSDPFEGMAYGVGASRSPTDIQSSIAQLRNTNPRQWLNNQAQRGNLRAGEGPYRNTETDVEDANDRITLREKAKREQEEKTPGRGIPAGSRPSGGVRPETPLWAAPRHPLEEQLEDAHKQEESGAAVPRIFTPPTPIPPPDDTAGKPAARGAVTPATKTTVPDDTQPTKPEPKTTPPSDDRDKALKSMQDKASQTSSLVQNMMNEMSAGGGGNLGGLASIPSLLKGLGSLLPAGAGSALGGAAAAVGIPLAGLAAVEGGGHMIQSYRNLGGIKGGGAAEGFGEEVQIRSLAMNPFISNDQARQIIQSALTEGYSGKQFDTVTDFMASNLKNMNMSVSDSVALLQKNVKEGGASIIGLGETLGTLKGLAGQGYNSLPNLKQGFAQASANLINQGMPGDQADQQGAALATMFSENPTLAGKGPDLVGNAFPGPMEMLLANQITGNPVPAGMAMFTDLYDAMNGKTSEIQSGALKKIAQDAWKKCGKPPNDTKNPKFQRAVAMFKYMLMGYQSPDANAPAAQLIAMFQEYVYGADPLQAANQQVANQEKVDTTVNQRDDWQMLGNDIVGSVAAVGEDFVDFLKGKGGPEQYSKNWQDEMAGASAYQMDALDRLTELTHGASGVEVVNPSGQTEKLDENNRTQMQGLSSGEYKVRGAGSNATPVKLSEAKSGSAALNQAFPGVSGNDVNVTGTATLNINVNQSGQVSAPSQIQVPLSQTKQAANQGAGNATINSG